MTGQARQSSFAADYVDVATRLVEFRTKFPEGSLQPADPAHPYRIENIDGTTWIVVVAAAYRTADDPRPGIGMAYERFPGFTKFTQNSELQNAETSAWGRAIVAALAADTKKGVASLDEIQNRRAEQEARHLEPLPNPVTRTKGPIDASQWETPAPVDLKRQEVIEFGKGHYRKPEEFHAEFLKVTETTVEKASLPQLERFLEHAMKPATS